MNTRLLRISERTVLGRCRIFPGLGQMQPVLMGFERGRMTLRIEGVSRGQACWYVLPFPTCKAQAKAAFAELEACKREGRRSDASIAWDTYKATQERAA